MYDQNICAPPKMCKMLPINLRPTNNLNTSICQENWIKNKYRENQLYGHRQGIRKPFDPDQWSSQCRSSLTIYGFTIMTGKSNWVVYGYKDGILVFLVYK